MRLNKYLAHATGVSRREADLFIAQGRVLVNGRPALLGVPIHEADYITVDGTPISTAAVIYSYVMFHKPVGYVCSRRAQGDHPTIYELLPPEYKALKPVGRLDRDSSGLILLTDDGDFAHQMTHPSFHKNKAYEVTLDHDLEPLHRQMISDIGVDLEDGKSQLQLERQQDSTNVHWKVIMHEGRNRQIRRTFAALGYVVTKLHRVQFGPYNLDDLAVGTTRKITDR